ncbi:HK97 gp10 family phage protein [Nocardia cyriacigeorgica]|uniref:HK97 gp10 family phage protein n=1 Tax=Nocardia cyriacigeorgica TaxID=135487 RepID=UPI0024562112|nr:HK97 gp10 family phage protein [Nocardia cyriacigeorgica]
MSLRARLQAAWSRIPGTEAHAARQASRELDELGRRIVANARRRINSRTGELSRSTGHRVHNDGRNPRLQVFATARHARYVHDGTRAHEIRARYAQALRFRMGGQTVFARRVWHPGTRANPFLADAVREETARRRSR